MKKSLFILIAVVSVLVLAVPLASVSAQNSLTFTEEQVNNTFRVTNPARRTISDVFVDLQPNQVTISYTYTNRRNTSLVAVVITPSIENGRVYWSIVSATANGQPVSDQLIAQANAVIEASWRRWAREQLPTGRVTAVTIDDSAITITG